MNQLLQDAINEVRGMTEAQLAQRITELQTEVIRLQDKLESLNMLGEFNPDKRCAFCGEPATTMTTCDDSVCQRCYQEFEDALNTGDTE